MEEKTVQVKRSMQFSHLIENIMETRKNPEFRKFIREFNKHHTT